MVSPIHSPTVERRSRSYSETTSESDPMMSPRDYSPPMSPDVQSPRSPQVSDRRALLNSEDFGKQFESRQCEILAESPTKRLPFFQQGFKGDL